MAFQTFTGEDQNQQFTGANQERDPGAELAWHPDAQSCLNLAAARLRYIAWSTKCYMNMRPLYQQHQSETEGVA
jgi:hypothetical protein